MIVNGTRRLGKASFGHCISTVAGVIFGLVALALPTDAFAAEGGGSHYNPGTNGDFAMALMGPPGWYLRNDLMYMDGSIGPVTRGNSILAEATQSTWVDTVKGIYLGRSGIWGGRVGLVMSVPVVLDAQLSGPSLEPPFDSREGSRSGFADIAFTGFLNWKRGDFNYSAGATIYAPTGYYDVERVIALGRNYWSIDPIFSFTWLDAKRGHEVSFISGYMLNSKNSDTDYQTGDEFHVDVNVAQHFSKAFAVGLVASYYRQTTDDNGPMLDRLNETLEGAGSSGVGGFRGEALGFGLDLKVSIRIADRDVNVIGKWMTDVDTKHRFDGGRFMLSAAFQF